MKQPSRPAAQPWVTFIKGMCMGAADVIPGVSGGTVAFLLGIYSELLRTLEGLTPMALARLLRQSPAESWRIHNGVFLLPLGAGIATSILSLSKLFLQLLDSHGLIMWAFFFGLIAASTVSLGRQLWPIRWGEATALAAGAAFSLSLVHWVPAQLAPTPFNFALAGFFSIIAMILPGISGAFILLLMGMYLPLLEALHQGNLVVIGCFGLGAVSGLVASARSLRWVLQHFEKLALATLTGVLVGSLGKLWPWQITTNTVPGPGGKMVATAQQWVSPQVYERLMGESAQLGLCVGVALCGMGLVYGLSRVEVLGATTTKLRC